MAALVKAQHEYGAHVFLARPRRGSERGRELTERQNEEVIFMDALEKANMALELTCFFPG